MVRSYYDDYARYSSRSSSHSQRRFLPPRETAEEKATRRAREDREWAERESKRSQDRTDRRDQSHRDDDSKKRKHEEGKPKGHETESSDKRPKVDQPTSSEVPASSTLENIPSESKAPPKTDIQAILSRPSYTIPKAPPTLGARFPNWCLRGVRFDLDVVPIDRDAMHRSLDVVKEDIDRMYNWQKLVDELQRVNRNNQEAMLTMENDKAEWARILKEWDDEIITNAAYTDELEAKLKTLENELVNSSNLHSQKEELLQNQVKEAHAAQARTEHALDLERKLTESLRKTVTT